MMLEVLGYHYENGSSKVVQGVKGGYEPPNAVAGGCGSYVTADSPAIYVKVRNVDTGETRVINMYYPIKNTLTTSQRMSRKRAETYVEDYQKAGQFEAADWNDWE